MTNIRRIMKITDSGIIIGQKKYGINTLIISIFSKRNGIIRGFYRVSKKGLKPIILDLVDFQWKSRIEESLGYLNFEIRNSFPLYSEEYFSNLIKISASEICLKLLPPKEENELLYEDLRTFIMSNNQDLKDLEKVKKYIIWELKFLKKVGYGLDLTKCSVTGSKKDLYYVSPKTGQVVTKKVGHPWKNKLLVLPQFLVSNEPVNIKDIQNGLQLTFFFLNKILEGLNLKQKKFIFREELNKKFS